MSHPLHQIPFHNLTLILFYQNQSIFSVSKLPWLFTINLFFDQFSHRIHRKHFQVQILSFMRVHWVKFRNVSDSRGIRKGKCRKKIQIHTGPFFDGRMRFFSGVFSHGRRQRDISFGVEIKSLLLLKVSLLRNYNYSVQFFCCFMLPGSAVCCWWWLYWKLLWNWFKSMPLATISAVVPVTGRWWWHHNCRQSPTIASS